MNQHLLTPPCGRIAGWLGRFAAVLAISLAPVVLAAANDAGSLKVAILAGNQSESEFDAALKTLGWTAKKYADAPQSWEALKGNLANYDLIVGAPGIKSSLPKTKEDAAALVAFMENGGAVILTWAIEPEQLDWLAQIDPKLALKAQAPARPPENFGLQDGKSPHSFRSTPNKLSDSGVIEKFFRRSNNQIWEWGAGWQNQPCTLIKRFGKGFLILSALRHPNADLFENAELMLRFQRQGIAYRNTTYHFADSAEIVPGRGEVRINITNTAKEPLDVTGIFRMTNGTETREIKRTVFAVKPGSSAPVGIPVMIDLRGKSRVEVAIITPDQAEVPLQKFDVELPEFLTVIPPAYRGMISTARRDKNVHFKLRIKPLYENIEGLPLELTVLDPNGKPVSQKTVPVCAGEFPAVMELPVDAPAGEYTIVAAARRNATAMESAQAKFRIVPVRPGQVIVDQDTVLLRNGKPFFPLGIYHVSGKGQELENAADLGFNLFQFWSWDVNADNLKRLAAKDVSIIWEGQAWGRAARIPSATSANDPRVLAELEIMRKAAAELKDNPTLAMWYVADEPPASQLPVLRKINNTWHEADEDHPTYLVATGNYELLQEACDILAIDVYPVYRGRRDHLSDVANATDAAMRGVDYRKPVIAVPQAFGNNKLHNEKPEDVRCSSYLFVVRGAKGVIWYCWKETGDNTGVEGSGHHPATQQVLKELVAEFKVLAPALMAPGGRMLKSKDGHVHALICGDGETGRYLVYVNADERASDAVLSVPDLAGKTLEGMFGAPEAAIQDGVLKINVPALGTGVFRIK